MPASQPLTNAQKLILVAVVLGLAVGGYLFLNHDTPAAPAPVNVLATPERKQEAAPSAAEDATDQPQMTATQIQEYLAAHYKGEATSGKQHALVMRVGEAIETRNATKDARKKLTFHLMNEPILINLFALPTGDVYVTTALVNRMRTEGELAAALSNGAAHALAGDKLRGGTDGKFRYTTTQETAADAATVKLMSAAGYDPNAYLGMFQVLTEAYNAKADVPFFATHPSAQWRLDTIRTEIKTLYPTGVPAVLSK